MAVINDCDTAVATDIKYELTPYSSVECAAESVKEQHIDDIRVSYKIMGQNFNPNDYVKEEDTRTVIRRRFTTDLMFNFTFSMKFSIVENMTKFFDSYLLDLRDFAFFISGYLKESPKMNIETHEFDYIGTSYFAKKYQEEAIYGYFSLDFSQDEQQVVHVWTA